MPIDTPTSAQVLKWLSTVLHASEVDDGVAHVFNVRGRRFEVPAERLDTVIASLAAKSLVETTLVDTRSCEVLVREEARFRPSIFFRDHRTIRKEDQENGLVYEFGRPSDEYFVLLLQHLTRGDVLRLFRPFLPGFRVQKMLEEDPHIDPLEIIKASFRNLLTARVISARQINRSDLGLHLNAFLFQLTYNLDVPLVEVRSWEDILRVGRLTRTRRSRVVDIDPPRRTYIPDLTYHYQMGVAADSPVLAFLSYYHVAEHFFESVYNDDLISAIQSRLTQPDFSYRRKRDITQLVREITKRLRLRGEMVSFNEQDALRLTLERYLGLSDLVEKIRSYDVSLLEHYRDGVVPFSGGEPVDLTSEDTASVWKSLASRIYKTRNAVVHAKEGDRSRYVPFEHDRVLGREVPIMRFIAEDIIVATSSMFR